MNEDQLIKIASNAEGGSQSFQDRTSPRLKIVNFFLKLTDTMPAISSAYAYSNSHSEVTVGLAVSQTVSAPRERAGPPDELRASLAGSLRSPLINEAYIEKLKAMAEERAANARTLSNRASLGDASARAAMAMVTAASTEPAGDLNAAQTTISSQMVAAHQAIEAYRDNS
ncbi:hypothetical protein LQ948_17975 [Jiella sp. MQZ9-1]|uniref:Uncharacterized protein n=1 Tax=Jiella flava TaxID=2816857 RepID=A0A939JTX2_9HYPH|nr:hypothetical protein [Jiella flava]MBO0664458.1 hypothetical protein [Jiella flava]MCD2473094.1 hypothetical protein [Jiella flava]